MHITVHPLNPRSLRRIRTIPLLPRQSGYTYWTSTKERQPNASSGGDYLFPAATVTPLTNQGLLRARSSYILRDVARQMRSTGSARSGTSGFSASVPQIPNGGGSPPSTHCGRACVVQTAPSSPYIKEESNLTQTMHGCLNQSCNDQR